MQVNMISDYVWEIPKENGMNVPVRVYASKSLLEKIKTDRTLVQAVNVSKLPGILNYSYVMPDGHEGYGFPIGGVAAFDLGSGVISPGGVGYDINCGVRLVRTNLTENDLRPSLGKLLDSLYKNVPSGLGSKSGFRFNATQLDEVATLGMRWALENGYAWEEDLKSAEEGGSMKGADPSKVSREAKARGAAQLGSLGSGNHFLEIEVVDKIVDKDAASAMGIKEEGQVLVLIHTGSRGYGHQVCSDYLQVMERAGKKYGIELPDRELAAVPFSSDEGQDYLHAMVSAANFAWTNRQLITHMVRESFRVLGDPEKLDMGLVYDVAHNIAKTEKHSVNGNKMDIIVHRKGATRAFGPESEFIPEKYRKIGQPVLIPGSMGTASYMLVGVSTNDTLSWGSAAHGAGRHMSRGAAKRAYNYSSLIEELRGRGIMVRAASRETVTEEAPLAYKNVDLVAEATEMAGLARRAFRMRPIGVVKG
ncbi:MAG: RtcB family protein [Nitrososphaerota archaeon]|nr:RtcB family protein [Nitrososphaerota archaeon]